MENGLSNSDVALLSRGGDDMFSGGGAFFWIFALLILAGGGFGFNGGNGGGYVTSAEFQAGLANQSTQSSLQSLAVETANNNCKQQLRNRTAHQPADECDASAEQHESHQCNPGLQPS